jgi:murein DD-endopeptidase MepM/ murein hydrolase activator NlpD
MIKYFSAPLLMALIYSLFGTNAIANSDALSFKNFNEFKQFHKNVIQVLIKREKLTKYPNKLILETASDKELSAIDFYSFFLSNAYARTPEHLCFFGGWPSVRTRNSAGAFRCRTPWSMRNRSEVSDFTPKYDPNHYCGAKTLFRCNPTLFGPGEDGKGTCITIANYSNVTSACYEKSQENIETIYEKYTTDPEYKAAYNKMSQEIMIFCKDHPEYSACTNLKQSVEKFYELVCSRVPDPVLPEGVTNTAGIWGRIANYFKSDDDSDEAQATPEEAAETTPVVTEEATPVVTEEAAPVVTEEATPVVTEEATPVVEDVIADPANTTESPDALTMRVSTSGTEDVVRDNPGIAARDVAAEILNASPQAVSDSHRPVQRPANLPTTGLFSIPSRQEALSFTRLRSRPFYATNNRQIPGLIGNLVSPLPSCGVNSRYNPARTIDGRTRPHPGTDLSAARGTRVNAIARGRIVRAVSSCRDQGNGTGCNNGYGNQIYIMHSRNGVRWYSNYIHLTTLTVDNRTVIEAGEQIGTVGNTGRSYGDHLHIEVMDRNQKRSNIANYYNGGVICGN